MFPITRSLAHHIARCRDKATGTIEFRASVVALGGFLTYECCRDWLPTREVLVPTPLGVSAPSRVVDNARVRLKSCRFCARDWPWSKAVCRCLPDAKILHVGYRRDEKTAQRDVLPDGPAASTARWRALPHFRTDAGDGRHADSGSRRDARARRQTRTCARRVVARVANQRSKKSRRPIPMCRFFAQR